MTTSTAGPATRGATTPAHLTTAASRYGVGVEDLKALGAFESDVFQFPGPEGPSILKVMPPGHRTAQQVQAEVDWLLALLEAEVPVSRPLLSRSGNWVEALSESGHVVVAFARAPGVVLKPADWTVEVIERWGELLGRLQAHSRRWTPPGPRRHTLAEQTYARKLNGMSEEFPEFHAAAQRLLKASDPLLGDEVEGPAPVGSSPLAGGDPVAAAGRDGGLIHADLHHGNLLLHEGVLTAIDFDDCAYGSFAFDLAMPIYYAVRTQREAPAEGVIEGFLPHLMRGFRRAAPDPAGGAKAIDLALRFRQVELVLALRAKIPPESWMPELVSIEQDLRERVVNEVGLVPIEVLERCLMA